MDPLPTELDEFIHRVRLIARASTMDQRIADQCVDLAVEYLNGSVDPGTEGGTPAKSVQLYRLVERVLFEQASASFKKQTWRALVLVCIENFSPFEASRILGTDETKIRSILAGSPDLERSPK